MIRGLIAIALFASVCYAFSDNTKKCVETCTDSLMKKLKDERLKGASEIVVVCGAYNTYKTCIHKCPDGSTVWETAAQQIGKTEEIESTCARSKRGVVEKRGVDVLKRDVETTATTNTETTVEAKDDVTAEAVKTVEQVKRIGADRSGEIEAYL